MILLSGLRINNLMGKGILRFRRGKMQHAFAGWIGNRCLKSLSLCFGTTGMSLRYNFLLYLKFREFLEIFRFFCEKQLTLILFVIIFFATGHGIYVAACTSKMLYIIYCILVCLAWYTILQCSIWFLHQLAYINQYFIYFLENKLKRQLTSVLCSDTWPVSICTVDLYVLELKTCSYIFPVFRTKSQMTSQWAQ